MSKKWLLFGLIIMSFGCNSNSVEKPKNLIEKDKMVAILYDISLLEAIKTQNRALQQQFAVRGYPTCWFVNADKLKDGKVNFAQLGSKGYEAGGPVNWIKSATTIIKPN